MAGSYDLWFRRKYSLPPTDPRYLEATDEQILTDFWAHYYEERRAAGKGDEVEDEDDDFDEDEIMRLMTEHPDNWLDVLNEKA